MKRKNPGVSLIVVLGISFAVLGIAIATLSSVSKGLEQGTAIERSNQIFFAAETGIEAALFHHNARGQGVDFPNSETVVNDDFPQHIFLPASSATVAWKVEGRDKPVEGIMHENQTIEIPFYWDNSEDPTDSPPFANGNFNPDHNHAGKLEENFSLSFDTSNPDLNAFDFGSGENEVFLDWSISRKHAESGFQTFLPDKNNVDICDNDSSFVCEEEFLTGDTFVLDSTEDADMVGKIFPGNNEPTTLGAFLDFTDNNLSLFKLSFRPLLPFSHLGEIDNTDDDTKIAGIPFEFDHVGAGGGAITVPKNIYTVTSEVSIGEFSRTIGVDVPEKTSVGSFNYVIFD